MFITNITNGVTCPIVLSPSLFWATLVQNNFCCWRFGPRKSTRSEIYKAAAYVELLSEPFLCTHSVRFHRHQSPLAISDTTLPKTSFVGEGVILKRKHSCSK